MRPRVEVVDGKKTCSKCLRLLPVSEFHRHSQTSSGLASACRPCTAAARKATYVPTVRTTAILVVDGKKLCTGCKKVLPVSEFGKSKATKTGLGHRCKKCSAAKQRARRDAEKAKDPEGYLALQRERQRAWRASAPSEVRKARGRVGLLRGKGVTAEWYEATLMEQGGVCAICKRPESKISSGGGIKLLAVDHDHATGLPRGLLCQQCNIGLGALRDDPALLEKAIRYLTDRPWEVLGAGVPNR